MALYFEQASIIAAVVCSLIVAGLLKGTTGVGMPIVALPNSRTSRQTSRLRRSSHRLRRDRRV
jgi:hypothetical protein